LLKIWQELRRNLIFATHEIFKVKSYITKDNKVNNSLVLTVL